MRCLVVGIGNLALNTYLPYLTGVDDVEVAVVSRNPRSAGIAAEKFGVAAIGSWAEAAAFRPDVAFVLATDTQHANVLDELVRMGVPRVFTEKPLVAEKGQERVSESDFTRALDIARAAADAGVEIAMGFNYRFFDTVRQAAAHLRDEPVGILTGVSADAHYACWSHTIDLIGMLCGPTATVSALAGTSDGTAPPRTIAFVTEAGVAGSLTGSSDRSWDDDLLRVSLVFDGGRIEFSDLDVAARTVVAADDRNIVMQRDRATDRWPRYQASFIASVTAYLQAVRDGVPAPVDVGTGLRELQFEAAVARSIAQGRAVDVQAEFPIDIEAR